MAKEIVNYFNNVEGLKLLNWDDDEKYLALHFEDDISIVLSYYNEDFACSYSPDISKEVDLDDRSKYSLGLITNEEFTKLQEEREAQLKESRKKWEINKERNDYKEYLRLKEKFGNSS